MMDPEVKKEWIAALRKGDKPQGRGWLERYGLFCCLGILCGIAVERGDFHRIQDGGRIEYVKGYSSSPKNLPVDIYGIDEFGTFNINEVVFSLAYLNDEGFTFDQIADIIEYFF